MSRSEAETPIVSEEEKQVFNPQTPMMKQYMQIKAENPGTLVMFRLGDFYEFFGEDAQTAARELDIVLTGRAAGMEERMPMCGIPFHALEQYLARLVQKGYRVAICEQLEDPRTVKGLVKRGIVRIVTPGTAMEIASEEPSSSYIAAILRGDDKEWGMSLCEVSTGEMRIAQFHGADALEELSAEMIRLKPCEILISENDYLMISGLTQQWLLDDRKPAAITLRRPEQFERQKSLEQLTGQFPEMAAGRPLWQEYPLAGDCAGAILIYLAETQKAVPRQIRHLELDLPGSHLIMDPTTFRNLEITRNLRTFDKKGSLFDLLDDTRTAAGSRLLKAWIEKPLVDKEAIEQRLDAVERLTKAWRPRQEIRQLLKEVYDMERLMTRVAYHRAAPKELLALKGSFKVLPAMRSMVETLPPTALFSEILEEFDTLEDLWALLESALTEDLPANWKEGGFIRDGYSAEADEHRLSARNGRQWMLELECREREKTGIKSLKIGYNKVFGYYFDVTKSNLSGVPDYFQRKQTLASGERFITDELIRLEGLVLGAEEKMLSLELELYQQLLDMVGQAMPRVQATSRALAKLDVFQSLAEMAVKHHYCRPVILHSGRQDLFFKDLRHPVVEQIMENDRFVPNDLHMKAETTLFIITGPNMGGKSTYCRSVAIAFVMAQLGSFVPASEARIPVRDRIFARVGASDDLRGGQSTFMMEMNEVAHILKHATAESLVVLDEVGRGTGTFDGLSVAWAVSDYMVSHIKAKTLFATHYLELTQMAAQNSAVQNLSLVVEEEGDRIVFLHKILPGSANKSYGVHVAKLAGLPESVIEKAETILETLEKNKDKKFSQEDPGVIESPWEAEGQDQLQLFAEPAVVPRTRQKVGDMMDSGGDPNISSVIQSLKKKNLMAMSPMEALNFLYKLQQKLQERA
jgi:DNA mismatch repair protein MutS